jgi:adenylate kinase family enzyme
MKNLLLIGGTMGVGKTTTCQVMKKMLNKCVYLDGDWCWDMHPFQVTEETKQMVMENICFLLNSFISCSAYETIIFSWVMHQQSIIDDILSRLDISHCRVHAVSLVCEEHALLNRLLKDLNAGIRDRNSIERSIERIPLYESLNTRKLDVTHITPETAADRIVHQILLENSNDI